MADGLLQRSAIADWNKLTKEQREAIIKNATRVQLFGEFIDDEPSALSNSGKRGERSNQSTIFNRGLFK